MRQTNADPTVRGVTILYLTLAAGGVVFAGVFLLLVIFRGPLLMPSSATEVIAFAFAGVGLTAVATAALLLRGRVPERPSSQSLSDFWNPATRARAILLWIVCENGALLAGLGYVLTAHLVPLAVVGVALLALAWFSPARLAGE